MRMKVIYCHFIILFPLSHHLNTLLTKTGKTQKHENIVKYIVKRL
jgi:hypothetical protein